MTIGIRTGIRTAATLILLMLAASAQAQLYKSVGPDGKVTYSDTPPASGNVVAKKVTGGAGDDSDGLPYELAQAVKNNPVTLYSADKCIPCDDGRKMLKERGIPFSEKTIKSNEDIAAVRKITSENQLPILMVGREKQGGFSSASWGSTLTAAGYPETSRLPKTYRNAAPVAAAPTSTGTAGKTAATGPTTSNSGDVAPAAGNAPPGFRF